MNSLPHWLKKRVVFNDRFFDTKSVLSGFSVNTVCESSRCPNISECFSSAFATFMILGKTCTRSCSFCSVKKAALPETVDAQEPQRIAACVKSLGLRYVVVTSVTRDDLPDGGAIQFVRVVEAIRREVKDTTIELLIPDLAGDAGAVRSVASSGADVVGHNLETVERLYPVVRREADYSGSLGVLRSVRLAASGVLTKSAILAGLGETKEELLKAMRDLRKADCDILTIGQYLSPSKEHHPVDRFVPPEEFEFYREAGLEMGFKNVSAAPFVRSSYHAEDVYDKCCAAAVS